MTTPTLTTRLSEPESTRLAELEPIVEQGLKNFREVGEALAEISDRRLYRGTHSTFKEYVQAKWDLSVRTAYDYIEAAETLKSLPAQCAKFAQTAPAAQVKKLAQVPVEKRAEVVEVASSQAKSEDRPMTAADITQAALPAPDWQAKANERLAVRNASKLPGPVVEVTADAAAAISEIEVCMEDLRITRDDLRLADIDRDSMLEVAKELAKVAKMLRRLAK